MRSFILLIISAFFITQSLAQNGKAVTTGAERTEAYLPLLHGKRIGVFANQTSVVGNTHLVDTLLAGGIRVAKIFGPEHGFRGTAGAGEKVKSGKDEKTGLPIISLYGNHKKPTKDDLKGIEIMLFDIQDVGVRFYTYISSLQYVIEACIENKVPLIILDRPNPNGFYVDGPVLKKGFESFIGMQPVPTVYGMTMAEYAMMLIGEKWLDAKYDKLNTAIAPVNSLKNYDLIVVPCKGYDHNTKYDLPVAPSPNLKNMQSIYLYPSTCLFEGTVMSEGRGTDYPFQVFGHPTLPKSLYHFVPKPNAGAKSSKCFGEDCYGWFIDGNKDSILNILDSKIQLKYILDAYRLFPGKASFFLKNNFFNKLAGNDVLMKQIKAGLTEEEIRISWQEDLGNFKNIRKKYLLYPDFE